MAPTTSKANYKTYEAQARMVRAIVAAHPEVKWNYKEIAACYGSDMSEHALNHRFRKIRAQCLVIKTAREHRLDMRHLTVDENELPSTKEGVDQKNIAKYFGQSTADGIQFQFRAYKKDAEKLRAVHTSGGDVANCLPLSSLPATPSKPAPSRPTTATPASRGAAAGTARKRPRIKRSSSDEERDDDDDDHADPDYDYDQEDPADDWAERDDAAPTPSRRGPKQARHNAITPRRQTAAHPNREDREDTLPANPVPAATAQKSLFGDPAQSPAASLTPLSPDPFMATSMDRSPYTHEDEDAYGDGEI